MGRPLLIEAQTDPWGGMTPPQAGAKLCLLTPG
jgi:hypothetical protein